MHFVAGHTCDYLPGHVEELLRLIYTYFSRSGKGQQVLEEYQELMKMAKQKMIQPARTRLLAMSEGVQRILNQWVALYGIFAMPDGYSKTIEKRNGRRKIM